MIDVNLRLRRSDDFMLDSAFEQVSIVTGIFGPSGAGKTTLLHLIAGLERADRGMIRFNDRVLFDSDARIDLPAHRRRIAVVFQDARLFPHRSVRGNLLYGWRRSENQDGISFERVVSILDLDPLLDRRIASLSGGEQQRVAIGRGLLSEPDVLLLDEPLASVDAGRRSAILRHLRQIRDELATPMLYVSHNLIEILQLTDRLVLMDRGRTVSHGRFDELALDAAGLEVMHDHGLTNVVLCRVEGHDAEAGLTRLVIPPAAATEGTNTGAPDNPRLNAPIRETLAAGDSVHAVIRPADIALARNRVEGISIRNQIAGVVAGVAEHAGRAIVRVNLSGADIPLFVEVSLRTVREMNLKKEAPAWALIKSNAVKFY